MSANGETADQMMRMTMQGVQVSAEVAMKLGGAATKSLSVLLYKIISDQYKVKGKTRLKSMLKSNEEVKIIAIKQQDLKQFYKEAKKYGVLYCVLMKEKGNDGVCDIMVKAKDLDKVNHIINKLEIATLDTEKIRKDIEKEQHRESKQPRESMPKDDHDIMPKEDHDKMVNEILKSIVPNETRTAKKENQSEPISGKSKHSTNRHSVRDELNEIKEKQKNRTKQNQKKMFKNKNTNNRYASKSRKPKKKER